MQPCHLSQCRSESSAAFKVAQAGFKTDLKVKGPRAEVQLAPAAAPKGLFPAAVRRASTTEPQDSPLSSIKHRHGAGSTFGQAEQPVPVAAGGQGVEATAGTGAAVLDAGAAAQEMQNAGAVELTRVPQQVQVPPVQHGAAPATLAVAPAAAAAAAAAAALSAPATPEPATPRLQLPDAGSEGMAPSPMEPPTPPSLPAPASMGYVDSRKRRMLGPAHAAGADGRALAAGDDAGKASSSGRASPGIDSSPDKAATLGELQTAAAPAMQPAPAVQSIQPVRITPPSTGAAHTDTPSKSVAAAAGGAAGSVGLPPRMRPVRTNARHEGVQRLYEFAVEVWPAQIEGPFRHTKVTASAAMLLSPLHLFLD